MKIQIDNQVIDINNGKTVISVIQRKPFPTFKLKLDFDFNDYPSHAASVKDKNFAEYWWLSNLWREFIVFRKGGQLKLF